MVLLFSSELSSRFHVTGYHSLESRDNEVNTHCKLFYTEKGPSEEFFSRNIVNTFNFVLFLRKQS